MGNSCSIHKQMDVSIPIETIETIETINTLDTECSICLDKIGNKKFCTLNCSHTFCEKCIQSWLEQSTKCPNCRAAMDCFDTIKSLRSELLCMSMMIDYILNSEEHEAMKGILWVAYNVNDPTTLLKRFMTDDIMKTLLLDDNELSKLKKEVATYKTAMYVIMNMTHDEIDDLISKMIKMRKETPLLGIFYMSVLSDFVDADLSRSMQYFIKVGNQPKYLNDPAFQKIKSDGEMKVFLQAIKANNEKLKSIGEDEDKFMEVLRNL